MQYTAVILEVNGLVDKYFGAKIEAKMCYTVAVMNPRVVNFYRPTTQDK